MIRQAVANPKTGCLEWTGSKTEKGYGRIYCPTTHKMKRAHRVVWEDAYGPIPYGMGVLHRCDNPSCVNIDHLFLGTTRDNNADRARKGRTHRPTGGRKYRGETIASVRGRIAAGEPSHSIAKDVGMSESYISEIAAGKYRNSG